jgi:hypothetical protein
VADMKALRLVRYTALFISLFAHRYWSGQPVGDEPATWEALLETPVRIGTRVS